MSEDLIELYLLGPKLLADAVEGMSESDLDAMPVPGRWSTRSVICHISDFEPIYADRIKRGIAEDKPTIFGGDPDLFASKLFYDQRDVQSEIRLITAIREHVAGILKLIPAEDFNREVIHSVDGPLTITTLLKRISNHIPHHVKFIEEKRKAMGF